MGYVPKSLINYLKMSGFNENESKVLTSKLEIKSISDTVKICKTFLNFKDPFRDFFTFLTLEVCITCYAKKTCICTVG